MAPKSRRSTKVKKSSAGSKKPVSIEMVKNAVTALGDRNGSTINAIFNYLVRTKKVSQGSRTLVILALGRACREGSMAKKFPNTFVLQGGKKKVASPKRRKARRSRKISTKKRGTKRSRRQRKRKSPKKTKKTTKRRKRTRKSTKKTKKARRGRMAVKRYNRPRPIARSRPKRKAARRINYRE